MTRDEANRQLEDAVRSLRNDGWFASWSEDARVAMIAEALDVLAWPEPAPIPPAPLPPDYAESAE